MSDAAHYMVTAVTRARTLAIHVEFQSGGSAWIPRSVILPESAVQNEGDVGELVIKEWFVGRVQEETGYDFATTVDQAIRPIFPTTPEQREVIDRAICSVRMQCGDPDLDEARAIELICADFLSDPGNSLPF